MATQPEASVPTLRKACTWHGGDVTHLSPFSPDWFLDSLGPIVTYPDYMEVI